MRRAVEVWIQRPDSSCFVLSGPYILLGVKSWIRTRELKVEHFQGLAMPRAKQTRGGDSGSRGCCSTEGASSRAPASCCQMDRFPSRIWEIVKMCNPLICNVYNPIST